MEQTAFEDVELVMVVSKFNAFASLLRLGMPGAFMGGTALGIL